MIQQMPYQSDLSDWTLVDDGDAFSSETIRLSKPMVPRLEVAPSSVNLRITFASDGT